MIVRILDGKTGLYVARVCYDSLKFVILFIFLRIGLGVRGICYMSYFNIELTTS